MRIVKEISIKCNQTELKIWLFRIKTVLLQEIFRLIRKIVDYGHKNTAHIREYST